MANEQGPGSGSESAATLALAKKVEKTKTRQKSYVMDLRIHSPASLGYLAIEGIDTAPALVRLARVKGLDIIAVTDFYSGAFIDRIVAAAKDSDLKVIPGTALRCSVGNCNDGVMTCLFPEGHTSAQVEAFVLSLGVPKSMAGRRDYVVKKPFAELLAIIDAAGAVALPSRIDKTPTRLSALPILIEQFGFRAFDLAYADSVKMFKARWPKIKFQLFSFSNAQALAQVGSRIAKVKMSDPGFGGISEMVARQDGPDGVAARGKVSE